jgi:hypothetical protein
MMDELMHDFKKGCGKSDAELDVAYKILNPSPVGGFVDSLVKMDKDYIYTYISSPFLSMFFDIFMYTLI